MYPVTRWRFSPRVTARFKSLNLVDRHALLHWLGGRR